MAIGSPMIINNKINHFITLSIDEPVTSAKYFNGPNSVDVAAFVSNIILFSDKTLITESAEFKSSFNLASLSVAIFN